MKVIIGSNNLAQNIAKKMSAVFVRATFKHFANQEIQVNIDGQIKNQEVIIIQSISNPFNNSLMELLLLANAAKGASKITALIPYFAYSRQDRPGEAFNLIINILKTAGINKIITLDLHSNHLEVENIDPSPLWKNLFLDKKEYVAVSPDLGGKLRAEKFSKTIGCPTAVIKKTRNIDGECFMEKIIGEIKNKHCIIIDDIVDSAGTICKAAKLLIKNGALSVKACATHPVLSKNAMELIEKSPIEELYVSNSITNKTLTSKIKVIDIENILVDYLSLKTIQQ